MLIVVYDSEALPQYAEDYVASFRNAHATGGFVIPVALDAAHMVPPKPISGIKAILLSGEESSAGSKKRPACAWGWPCGRAGAKSSFPIVRRTARRSRPTLVRALRRLDERFELSAGNAIWPIRYKGQPFRPLGGMRRSRPQSRPRRSCHSGGGLGSTRARRRWPPLSRSLALRWVLG